MNSPAVAVRPWSGFAIVGFAYVVALVVAHTVTQVLVTQPPLYALAAADVAATVAVFVFSRAFNNTSVYDPYWSLVPIPIAVYFWVGPTAGVVESIGARQVAVLVLVTAYGLRLTWNWIRGWPGLQHEDWRYADFREKTGKAYWLVSFVALHFFPTVMTFLGCLPLEAAMKSGVGFGVLDGVAVVVTAGAITIEGIADNQLRAFRQSHDTGGICNVGLWQYSRHPNYFGEISFWLGLFLFGLAGGAPLWTGVGFVAMVALFVGASTPMAEKRSLSRRPHYAEHQQKVSMLVPWFPRKG